MSIAANTGSARGANVPTTLVGTPTAPAAPTPADKPAAAGAQAPANRFAELLRRNRAEAAKPMPHETAPAPRTTSRDGVETGDTSAIEASVAPANAARARALNPKEATGRTSAGAVEPGSQTSDAASAADGAERGEASDRMERRESATSLLPERLDARALAPDAREALRGLAGAAGTANEQAAGAAVEDRAAAAAGATTKHGLGHARGMASVDAADGRRTALIDAGRDSAPGLASDALHVAHAETSTSFDFPGAARAQERAIDASSASLALGAPSPHAEPASAAAPSNALTLATPIDAPDFATALGVRVSVLVHDGVQQAELHLNPAETGPVSIHITLDGNAARVDFGADVAATRAAIERGLPELASALRDAGFTLAGGGVSQHAGGRADDDGSARASARLHAGADPLPTSIGTGSRTVARIVPAGAIDLYA